MARFRGTIKGSRGQASRLGTSRSGIDVKVNGWDVGVSVNGCENNATSADLFEIYLSGGSNGSDIRMIGTVTLEDGKPTFRLANSIQGGVAQ